MSPRITSAFVAIILFITTGVLSQSPAVHAAVPSPFDSSFGTNGYVKTSIPPQHSDTLASQIITDSTGRLYTAIAINGRLGVSRVSIVRTSSDGTIDTTYGTQGRTVSVSLLSTTIAIQPDNKVILAGFGVSDGKLHVQRYRANGTLDTTFATDGLYTLDSFPGSRFMGSPISIAVDSANSKFILGTMLYSSEIQNTKFYFLALRFNGQLDWGWANGGAQTVIPFASSASAWSSLHTISVLSDGSTIAVGSAFNSGGQYAIVLIKFTPNGYLDSNFDGSSGSGNGLVVVPFASESNAILSAMTVLGDGTLVLAGYAGTYYSGPNYFAMAKFTSIGIPDTSFGTNGFLLSSTPHAAETQQVSVVFQEANGDFIFPIQAGTSSGFMRVLGNGTISSALRCSLCLYSSVQSTGYSLALQSTGKAVMVGQLTSTSQAFSVRLTAAGVVDETFHNNPLVINELALSNAVVGVVPQLDGSSIVVSQASVPNGFMDESAGARPVLFKILANGTLDASFGTAGYSFISPSNDVQWNISAITTQTDGKILIVSTESAAYPEPNKISLSRVLPSGVLDSSFGINGTVTTTENETRLAPRSILVAFDGKILVTVGRRTNFIESEAIFRYTATGAVDSSFSDSNNIPGTVVSPILDSYGLYIFAANGKFMLTATTLINGTWFTYIARINSDGSLDTNFNSVGYRIWESGQALSADYFSNVLVDSNGLITAQGHASVPSDVDVLLQLNPDGSSHTEFGTSGRLQFTVLDTDTMRWASLSMILATNDGFIVVGDGELDDMQQTDLSFVARVTSSGQMNSTFGTNGVIFSTPDDDAGFSTIAATATDQFLIGGSIKVGDATMGLIMKMSMNSTTVPSSSTTPPITPPTSAKPTPTTVPVVASKTTPSSGAKPSATTVPVVASTTVPSSGAKPSATTVPVVASTKDSIHVFISVTQASLLKKAKLTVPKGGTVVMKVTTPLVCRVVKSKVVAVSTGTCQVSLSVVTSAKKKTTKTTSFKFK